MQQLQRFHVSRKLTSTATFIDGYKNRICMEILVSKVFLLSLRDTEWNSMISIKTLLEMNMNMNFLSFFNREVRI